MVAGDALDRYVTVPLENRTHNTALRILARVGLNPPQSFANLMMFRYPWRRENRSTVTQYDGVMYLKSSQSLYSAVNSKELHSSIPKFEVAASLPVFYEIGGLTCLGGGGTGSFRVTDVQWWVVEVSGCTLGNSMPSRQCPPGGAATHSPSRWDLNGFFIPLLAGVPIFISGSGDRRLQRSILMPTCRSRYSP